MVNGITEANAAGARSWNKLLPYSKATDEALVSPEIVVLEIIQKPSSLPDELQKTTAGVVIFQMGFEVAGQMFDPLAE